MKQRSLQETYAPQGVCYGCGPSNPNGFKIQSYVEDKKIVARWQPQSHHHAFPNILNGGVIGTILDCHCNWAAAWYLMQEKNSDQTPCTVTAEYTIKLIRPTPMDGIITLEATLEHLDKNIAFIKGQLIAKDEVCDTCEGTFVAVSSDHPAYHRR